MYTTLDDRSLKLLIPKMMGTTHALLSAEYAHRFGETSPDYRGTEIKRAEISNAPGFPDDTMPESWRRYMHKRLAKYKRPPTWTNRPDPRIDLRKAAFQARKAIGSPLAGVKGTVPCPACHGTIKYRTHKKHFNLVNYKCSTENCIEWHDPTNSTTGKQRPSGVYP